MKKIVLLLAFCLSIGNVFAQDADKLRDEGDAALKAKNYAKLLQSMTVPETNKQ